MVTEMFVLQGLTPEALGGFLTPEIDGGKKKEN
jgi:hypothetical protein